MVGFSSFFQSLLSTFAAFLWSDPMRWIVGVVLLIGIVVLIKRIIS